MVRDWWLCQVLSVMFELLEYTLQHQLPNFNECWWDHVCYLLYSSFVFLLLLCSAMFGLALLVLAFIVDSRLPGLQHDRYLSRHENLRLSLHENLSLERALGHPQLQVCPPRPRSTPFCVDLY